MDEQTAVLQMTSHNGWVRVITPNGEWVDILADNVQEVIHKRHPSGGTAAISYKVGNEVKVRVIHEEDNPDFDWPWNEPPAVQDLERLWKEE